ncbi:MAG: 5-(carboxyamino)imidazole ribonucleotide synthase [Chthoniobacterales bacterium]
MRDKETSETIHALPQEKENFSISPVLPGGTIGILGGGQLGRMTAIAARKMGYRVHVYEPSPNCPAGEVCDLEINASYDDEAALCEFAKGVDVITLEFENIPSETVKILSAQVPVHPSANILHTCQNREREKCFLRENNIPHAPFAIVTSEEELQQAVDQIGLPCVLKTADFGYDGKGQVRIKSKSEVSAAWATLNGSRAVLEKWISFEKEVSVICARSHGGESACLPLSENIHTNHILDISIVPGRVSDAVRVEAERIALRIAEVFQLVGLIAVEFFVGEDGHLLVNELAPRPHNSGHYSFDACITSQFEQHVRAVCGLPLGSFALLSPVVMVNILGDAWQGEKAPNWLAVLKNRNAKLHLYGKRHAKPGRKMGHFCVLAPDIETALKQALEIKGNLSSVS